jgi:hypothetical protein
MLTNADLMAIFNFTEDDLAANRAGRMSARQATRLQSDYKNVAIRSVLVVSIFSCLGCVSLTAALIGKSLPGIGDAGSALMMVAVIAIVVFVTIAIQQTKTQFDLKQRAVTYVDGGLKLKLVPAKAALYYKVEVASKTFDISREVFDTLYTYHKIDLEQRLYRVYYAPETKKLLSAEILDAPES